MDKHLAAIGRDEQIVGTMKGIALLVDKLADALVVARAEQAELRDEVHALANRIESVARAIPDELATKHWLRTGKHLPRL